MGWVERSETDTAYWNHAFAALAEGLCPDCSAALESRPLTTDAGRQVPIAACTPCETEWIQMPGAPRPARFRALAAIMRDLGR
jgi:hypothetical protein